MTRDELGSHPRIVVVGTTGSGKTTVGRRIAGILGVPFVELDALNWGPNWTERPLETFRQELAEAVTGPSWVIDGNYRKVRDVYLPRVSTVVWLDYPFLINLWQLLRRTLRRSVRAEVLWNGNVERLSTHLFTKDSLILWFLRSYWRRRRTIPRLVQGPNSVHLTLVRLRGRRETEDWLNRVREGVGHGEIAPDRDRP